MQIEEIKNKVRALIAKKFEVSVELGDSDCLLDYGLGVDSVSSLEFVVALEKEFGVEIDESEVTPDILMDINSVAGFVDSKT